MMTSHVMTEYLTRMRDEGEFDAMLAFDRWLQALPH